jgi:hypothetical protein
VSQRNGVRRWRLEEIGVVFRPTRGSSVSIRVDDVDDADGLRTLDSRLEVSIERSWRREPTRCLVDPVGSARPLTHDGWSLGTKLPDDADDKGLA